MSSWIAVIEHQDFRRSKADSRSAGTSSAAGWHQHVGAAGGTLICGDLDTAETPTSLRKIEGSWAVLPHAFGHTGPPVAGGGQAPGAHRLLGHGPMRDAPSIGS